jgi:hypothetical protein
LSDLLVIPQTVAPKSGLIPPSDDPHPGRANEANVHVDPNRNLEAVCVFFVALSDDHPWLLDEWLHRSPAIDELLRESRHAIHITVCDSQIGWYCSKVETKPLSDQRPAPPSAAAYPFPDQKSWVSTLSETSL